LPTASSRTEGVISFHFKLDTDREQGKLGKLGKLGRLGRLGKLGRLIYQKNGFKTPSFDRLRNTFQDGFT